MLHPPPADSLWLPKIASGLAQLPRWATLIAGMIDLLKRLGGLLVGVFRSHAAREAEMAFLRQQLVVLQRSAPARLRLRPLERAAFVEAYSGKKLKNLILGGSGAFGNTATRMEAFVVKGGAYVYGSYPDLDALYQLQASELDHKKRAAILEKLQQILVERMVYAPIWQLGFLNGVGPRVGQSGFGLITDFAYTAPYEDITIKGA